MTVSGHVRILASGSVLDADDASGGDDVDTDVRAVSLSIEAGKGVGVLSGNSLGLAVNALDTEVERLSVKVSGSDGVNVLEKDALTLGDTREVVVRKVRWDGRRLSRCGALRATWW